MNPHFLYDQALYLHYSSEDHETIVKFLWKKLGKKKNPNIPSHSTDFIELCTWKFQDLKVWLHYLWCASSKALETMKKFRKTLSMSPCQYYWGTFQNWAWIKQSPLTGIWENSFRSLNWLMGFGSSEKPERLGTFCVNYFSS